MRRRFQARAFRSRLRRRVSSATTSRALRLSRKSPREFGAPTVAAFAETAPMPCRVKGILALG